MRAYSISITSGAVGTAAAAATPNPGPQSTLFIPPSLAGANVTDVGGAPASYSSFVNGKYNPNALNVEFDINVAKFAEPGGDSFIEISGVSVQEISQAHNLNTMNISISGGMYTGLPLASADYAQGQYGILVQGQILQAFGNWIGVAQTIDFILAPASGTIINPLNLVLSWAPGQPLSQALQNTLKTAFPGYTIVSNISPNLVQSQYQTGYYGTLYQLATYIKSMTRALLGGPRLSGLYPGVDITMEGTTITLDDGTVPTAPKMINFYDLIGQPTWLDSGTIQFKCPMRADIKLNDFIKFPQTQVTAAAGAPAIGTDAGLTFQGQFQVTGIRHVGKSRQADAASWVSIINCANNPTSVSTSIGPPL